MNINPLIVPTFLLAAALFWLGVRLWPRIHSLAGRISAVAVASLLAVPGLLFVIYYFHLFDSAAWFYRFRAAQYTELTAGALGLLAGLLFAALRSRPILKYLFSAGFALVLLIPYVKPIIRPLDFNSLEDRWNEGVCLQSSTSSCGPACAATLLRLEGLEASERELAHESYTYTGGTECWYLVRAMRRRGLDLDVVVDSPGASPNFSPAIAGTRLVEPVSYTHLTLPTKRIV